MPDPRFRHLFESLLSAYGPQHWWPGDSPFEIMVGAVLTQNTAWSNVEKAIGRLQSADALDPRTIDGMPSPELADLIRPAGYFNVKAGRLRNLCRFVLDSGGVEALAYIETGLLRRQLLAVHGVGPETADDILLYAFDRPVFVVDAYTRRLGQRMGLLGGDEDYETVRSLFERALGADSALFNELHGLIVHHAKHVCRKRPRCDACCLREDCRVPDAGLPSGKSRGEQEH